MKSRILRLEAEEAYDTDCEIEEREIVDRVIDKEADPGDDNSLDIRERDLTDSILAFLLEAISEFR
ncbi:hypothetical protein VSDG_05905 [Cytospora chrysosperma]|uniref:Uncharacterized protein n=1 Tax=Cytospora chrysosperma TaxID=252740 RepID=A0A423VU04_CYTCH|nr:hypothetical protein VSDG_05905 [Valsa sordida]